MRSDETNPLKRPLLGVSIAAVMSLVALVWAGLTLFVGLSDGFGCPDTKPYCDQGIELIPALLFLPASLAASVSGGVAAVAGVRMALRGYELRSVARASAVAGCLSGLAIVMLLVGAEVSRST